MAKKLKQLSYVERLKTFISRMQTSNWVEDGDTPTPSSLTKIQIGDIVKKVKLNLNSSDWDNVISKITNEEIINDPYYDSTHQWLYFISAGEGSSIIIMCSNDPQFPAEMKIVFNGAENGYIYSNNVFEPYITTKGLQETFIETYCDENGVWEIDKKDAITELSPVFEKYFNGVLIGLANDEE